MKKFEEQKFNIPALKGLSAKSVEEHLKLYSGYVKNTNLILEKITQYESYIKEDAFAPYVIGELKRRFSFEYNGMRNHEVYFSFFEGGSTPLSEESALRKTIETEMGSFENFLTAFKNLATITRGIGWAVLWYDNKNDRLITSWVDEQHLGQLNNAIPLLMLDMWEHSYVYDYQPSGKKQYVEDFFENLNWEIVEKRYKETNS